MKGKAMISEPLIKKSLVKCIKLAINILQTKKNN